MSLDLLKHRNWNLLTAWRRWRHLASISLSPHPWRGGRVMKLPPPAPTPPAGPSAGFYSQHGEDIALCKCFTRAAGPKFFVEVGMIDGRRFSNTLALEQRGWRGVCVEAHPHYVEYVRRNRPGSTVVHAAVSDHSCQAITFHADPRGDLSTLEPRDDQQMRERFGHWYRGYQAVTVPARTLDDILQAAHAPIGMEVISIDIEGTEEAALRGLNLARWRPRVLILEADDLAAQTKLDHYLLPRGYHLARRIEVNVVYACHRGDARRLRRARIDQLVYHTAHPGDPDVAPAYIIPSAYETPRQFAWRYLTHHHKAA